MKKLIVLLALAPITAPAAKLCVKYPDSHELNLVGTKQWVVGFGCSNVSHWDATRDTCANVVSSGTARLTSGSGLCECRQIVPKLKSNWVGAGITDQEDNCYGACAWGMINNQDFFNAMYL